MNNQSSYYIKVKNFPLYVNINTHQTARAEIGQEEVILHTAARGLGYSYHSIALTEFKADWMPWDEYCAKVEGK